MGKASQSTMGGQGPVTNVRTIRESSWPCEGRRGIAMRNITRQNSSTSTQRHNRAVESATIGVTCHGHMPTARLTAALDCCVNGTSRHGSTSARQCDGKYCAQDPARQASYFGPKNYEKTFQELQKNDQKIMQIVVQKVVQKMGLNVVVIRSIVVKLGVQKMVQKEHKN